MQKKAVILGLTAGDDCTTYIEVKEDGQRIISPDDLKLSLLWRITKAIELTTRDTARMAADLQVAQESLRSKTNSAKFYETLAVERNRDLERLRRSNSSLRGEITKLKKAGRKE